MRDVNDLIDLVNMGAAERDRAVDALLVSEESYRLLFERHPAAMWLFDTETLRFLVVNDAAVAAYGYTREEFLGMTTEDIRLSDDENAPRDAVAEPVTGNVSARVRHRTKDGRAVDVLAFSSMVEFGGRPVGLVLAQDLTEQNRLEAELRQAQKMDAIGRLAGGVAHDFNNLLLVIRGYSAFLLAGLTDEKLREHVHQIDNAALQAAEFTRQLLAFSRQQVLRPEVIDPNLVVQETAELVRRMLRESIELEVELGMGVDSILADRGQLGQVILNLLVNARDAMGAGGTLTVHTENVEITSGAAGYAAFAPGNYVLLRVSDNGPGMDEQTRSHMFDPFFTTKETGTGLGLATVHGIVAQSGGHIRVESELGIGTTFEIYFPVAVESATPAAEPQEVRSLEGDETILLVEDTELVRVLVTEALESYGYTVLAAANGQEAIEIDKQRRGDIDLLLTDVVMPQMNGHELAAKLASGNPGLRVIFTSGYAADTMVRRGIEEARAAFIQKPYLPDDLARMIRTVLD